MRLITEMLIIPSQVFKYIILHYAADTVEENHTSFCFEGLLANLCRGTRHCAAERAKVR